MIRECSGADLSVMCEIINDAAQAYRGIIPADRWHEPYMPMEELKSEIAAGVRFWGCESDGELLGVMGMQDKGEVDLIRHAYVKTAKRKQGIGSELLRHIEKSVRKPILLGTWRDATWAVAFYEKNGYRRLSRQETERLLRKFWSIPERQIETSVVLANAAWKSERG
jgi:GNAT superfamily N-acetyltransferase